MENKSLDILVIEDNSKFIEIARSVYDKDSTINPAYAQNYEEAIKLLERRPN